MASYISGTKDRIFINPTLGCDSNCSYCYLGTQGLDIGKKTISPKSAEFLIEGLLAFPGFRKGKEGTVISIGCYSECWSSANIAVTKDFIKAALDFFNPIQFATKRSVSTTQLADIFPLIQWSGQLSLFISCSTISQWRTYEKGTSKPQDRFREITELLSNGLKVCIYIKPVLDSVTINDLDLFADVIDRTGCSVVVGDIFNFTSSNSRPDLIKAPIPSTGLYVCASNDMEYILNFFRAKKYICYNNSVEAINFWRSE